jgi:hypothetical protein
VPALSCTVTLTPPRFSGNVDDPNAFSVAEARFDPKAAVRDPGATAPLSRKLAAETLRTPPARRLPAWFRRMGDL